MYDSDGKPHFTPPPSSGSLPSGNTSPPPPPVPLAVPHASGWCGLCSSKQVRGGEPASAGGEARGGRAQRLNCPPHPHPPHARTLLQPHAAVLQSKGGDSGGVPYPLTTVPHQHHSGGSSQPASLGHQPASPGSGEVSGSTGTPNFSDKELALLSDWQIPAEGAHCAAGATGAGGLACGALSPGFAEARVPALSAASRPPPPMFCAEILILKRPDGSSWQLGSGGFGTVSTGGGCIAAVASRGSLRLTAPVCAPGCRSTRQCGTMCRLWLSKSLAR